MNVKHNKKTNINKKNKTIELKESIDIKENSPKKSPLIKPDFSPITEKENIFVFKSNGSYKKRKINYPESPIKISDPKFLTPVKIEGRNLFGHKNVSFYHKINFEEKYPLINSKDNDTLNNIIKKNISQNKNKNKIDNYIILKTIIKNKTDEVYKVQEKSSNKIYCIKKSLKNSSKNDYNTIKNIFIDFKNKNEEFDFCSRFCEKYLDYWLEKCINLFKSEENLFILSNFYINGDILDYLEKLERNKYKFSSDFYWDIIFEMIMGVYYFHKKGYIHFDIKPTNFLVDNEGYIKLNDFGLSHKITELVHLDEIFEGDARYISKEVLSFSDSLSKSKINNISTKSDVFSLGLTILEIVAKIELPINGKLWHELRGEKFIFSQKLIDNSNIENKEEFIKLISEMILPIEKRPDLIELIEKYKELNDRFKILKQNKYKKSINIINFYDNEYFNENGKKNM